MSKKSSREYLDIFDWVPVNQNIDLGVTAQTLSVTTSLFDYITYMTITYARTDAAIEWSEFEAGSALTNGITFYIDGVQFGKTINTVAELAELGELYISPADNDSMYLIQVKIDFTKICSNLGLQTQTADGDRTIDIVIGDDTSGATTILTLNVFGWKAK